MIIHSDADSYASRNSMTEPSLLRDLRKTTSRELEYDNMLSGPVVGAFLQILVQTSGARNVLEVGTFTGYGTIWMAMGLPPDGQILTCESNEKYARIARRFFERFRTPGKTPNIEILQGLALSTLPHTSHRAAVQPDFIFLDADKEQYPEYYELLLPVLRPGGLMVIDNAFWGGAVWDGSKTGSATKKPDRKASAIDRLNRMITEDPRVQNVLLTIRDGLHIVRKKE